MSRLPFAAACGLVLTTIVAGNSIESRAEVIPLPDAVRTTTLGAAVAVFSDSNEWARAVPGIDWGVLSDCGEVNLPPAPECDNAPAVGNSLWPDGPLLGVPDMEVLPGGWYAYGDNCDALDDIATVSAFTDALYTEASGYMGDLQICVDEVHALMCALLAQMEALDADAKTTFGSTPQTGLLHTIELMTRMISCEGRISSSEYRSSSGPPSDECRTCPYSLFGMPFNVSRIWHSLSSCTFSLSGLRYIQDTIDAMTSSCDEEMIYCYEAVRTYYDAALTDLENAKANMAELESGIVDCAEASLDSECCSTTGLVRAYGPVSPLQQIDMILGRTPLPGQQQNPPPISERTLKCVNKTQTRMQHRFDSVDKRRRNVLDSAEKTVRKTFSQARVKSAKCEEIARKDTGQIPLPAPVTPLFDAEFRSLLSQVPPGRVRFVSVPGSGPVMASIRLTEDGLEAVVRARVDPEILKSEALPSEWQQHEQRMRLHEAFVDLKKAMNPGLLEPVINRCQ